MSVRILQPLVFAFVLLSCGQTNKVNSQEETPITQTSTPQVDTVYSGGGNEPGWHVVLLTNPGGRLTYDLVLDYGESQYTGIANRLPSPGENMAAHYVLHDDTRPLVLSVSNDTCVDDADRVFKTSVSLSDKNFILKGCGRFH